MENLLYQLLMFAWMTDKLQNSQGDEESFYREKDKLLNEIDLQLRKLPNNKPQTMGQRQFLCKAKLAVYSEDAMNLQILCQEEDNQACEIFEAWEVDFLDTLELPELEPVDSEDEPLDLTEAFTEDQSGPTVE